MKERKVLSPIFPKFHRLGSLALLLAALSAPAAAQLESPLEKLSMLLPSSSLVIPGTQEELAVHEVRSAPPLTGAIDLTAQPDDLWVRIRHGFAMTNLNDELSLHYQQWYQNRPDALRRMVERARPFMYHIVEELERRGMPTELALLPMVESSFNSQAYSRAHASGLWQFIPATGKRFNLEQNWWRDERRDVVASTGAALDYLQTIYEMHGDWHLALASYNWGEGAVKRAIEKNTARGLPTDYASLTMPQETRHYVPKLQALKNIFGNPGLMAQLGLPAIRNKPYFATIGTDKPMDVKTAARLANMPVDQFLALNPSHNRPVIKADTAVVIPADKLETFQNNLENNAAPLTEWQAYTLKPGEKLDKVAPRFGITLDDLRRVNGLHGKLRLAAGSTLLVPAGKGADDLSAFQNSPALPQIVEPEPVVKTTGKGSKYSRLASASDKSSAKTSGKLAAAGNAKAPSRSAKAGTAKPSKTASGKGPSTAKVAKSTTGRRG